MVRFTYLLENVSIGYIPTSKIMYVLVRNSLLPENISISQNTYLLEYVRIADTPVAW